MVPRVAGTPIDVTVWSIFVCVCVVGGSAAKKPRAPKPVIGLAKPLPEGEVLTDLTKKGQWKLGKPIGSGGFGLIYLGKSTRRRSFDLHARTMYIGSSIHAPPLLFRTTDYIGVMHQLAYIARIILCF